MGALVRRNAPPLVREPAGHQGTSCAIPCTPLARNVEELCA
jgi:hypothetical protein